MTTVALHLEQNHIALAVQEASSQQTATSTATNVDGEKKGTTSTVLAVLNDLMDIVQLTPTKWTTCFVTFFSLLSDLCGQLPSVVELMRHLRAVSLLTNIYLNVQSPEALIKYYGRVPLMGNQYQTPDMSNLLTVILILLNVSEPRPQLLVDCPSTGVTVLTKVGSSLLLLCSLSLYFTPLVLILSFLGG